MNKKLRQLAYLPVLFNGLCNQISAVPRGNCPVEKFGVAYYNRHYDLYVDTKE